MGELLTVGVEEEFLLADPVSGVAMPVSEDVIAADAPADAPAAGPVGRLKPETSLAVIETASEPHRELSRLADDLRSLRSAAATAAEAVGCAVLPCATEPLPAPPSPPTGGERYRRIYEKYGARIFGHMTCGMHIHIGMPDRERAVAVSNHLRPWLPAFQALAANSPYALGEDTGWASFRSVWWGYMPVAGPAPVFASAAAYDALLDQLVASGVILDRKMAYWFARPSEFVPTIEVRVTDVCPTADTAVLLAALTRALVATCQEELDAGAPPPAVSGQLLAAAHWQAARYGMEGDAVDVFTGHPVPAWSWVEKLVKHITPALSDAGDLAYVTGGLAELRAHGSWAARQRGIVSAGGGPADVAAYLASLLLK
ncbi:carboxylate-amine ligase [Streptomyces ginkgonis]|uniref:carboxylate-amine ligase n=1 Tax=Streptomyces ginkgonis TaxID=1812259 RepID=UPI002176E40F|nr:glutamate--cysteine ligase [Streptomyces ginkgonis]